MTEALTQPQDRRKYIGGSDIAAILGISPWKTAVDLWIDKTTPPREDSHNWQAKARGTRMEPYILDMVRSEYGLRITAANQRYKDEVRPYFACEVDAETLTLTGPPQNIEIKTVHPFKSREWGEVDTDSVPLHYLAQVQWGLGITGREVCHVFALIGDDLRHYPITRDEETIVALREKADEFWLKYVVPGLRPPLDYADSRTLETLKRLFPGTDGTAIEATVMHEHWRAVMTTAQDMVKKYEGVVDGARAHILAEMGSAARLTFADGKEYRRKLIAKKAYSVEYPASTYIDFRLANTKE
jgi:putative phage-type endonuclease